MAKLCEWIVSHTLGNGASFFLPFRAWHYGSRGVWNGSNMITVIILAPHSYQTHVPRPDPARPLPSTHRPRNQQPATLTSFSTFGFSALFILWMLLCFFSFHFVTALDANLNISPLNIFLLHIYLCLAVFDILYLAHASCQLHLSPNAIDLEIIFFSPNLSARSRGLRKFHSDFTLNVFHIYFLIFFNVGWSRANLSSSLGDQTIKILNHLCLAWCLPNFAYFKMFFLLYFHILVW